MKLEHIALWTGNLEVMKDFYVGYLNGRPGEKYVSEHEFSALFQSYFLSFDSGSRLEIMEMETIPDINTQRKESIGLTHLAFSMSDVEEVRQLTKRIKDDGFTVVLEPHFTGDGYFESCILDPDGNRVELVVPPEGL
jgi:Lactoylglutathione lyase and related lyases